MRGWCVRRGEEDTFRRILLTQGLELLMCRKTGAIFQTQGRVSKTCLLVVREKIEMEEDLLGYHTRSKKLVSIYRCQIHSSPDQCFPAPAAAVSRTAELPALHLQEFGLAFTQIRLSPGTANQCPIDDERNCVSPGRSVRPPDEDPTR